MGMCKKIINLVSLEFKTSFKQTSDLSNELKAVYKESNATFKVGTTV